ncbi:HemK2/MTQ2 family protein methyltransferase [Streptomyces sp. NPDC006923]|uniref:HemK2/MTQ2 family protein methyltransferase n=1 Tax=Streptomyces sp. NPDC006923 TaxID=3155355 RepID=UPI0033E8F8E6
MTLIALPGVYAPQDDTALLAEALRAEALPPRAETLDVGTGTGALALAAARRGAVVTAVDISWRCVLSARLNARLARLPVRVLRGNLLAPVAGRSFDVILANPPYVPAPSGAWPGHRAARAWDAGNDGRLLLDRICQEAPPLLRPGGVLLIVHSALCAEDPTLLRLRAAGLHAAVIERRQVAFGPVLRGRWSWLRSQGLVEEGQNKEELVVVRARRTS